MCVLLVLAGCKFTLPEVASATVERYQSGSTLQSRSLNSSQIHALSRWFSKHETGWSSSVVSYVPTIEVRVKHSNGDVSVVNILSGIVVVYNSSGQYEQRFSQTDLAEILSILGAE